MSKPVKLKIEYRNFGAVVICRGRVVFRSQATDARNACGKFIEYWRSVEAERAEEPAAAPANLAELVQW